MEHAACRLPQEEIGRIVRSIGPERLSSWRSRTADIFLGAVPRDYVAQTGHAAFVCLDHDATEQISVQAEGAFTYGSGKPPSSMPVVVFGPDGRGTFDFHDILSFYPAVARRLMDADRPHIVLTAAATLAAFGVTKVVLETGDDGVTGLGFSATDDAFLVAIRASFPGCTFAVKDGLRVVSNFGSRLPSEQGDRNGDVAANDAVAEPLPTVASQDQDVGAMLREVERLRDNARTFADQANALRQSTSYRIGNAIIRPAWAMKKIFTGREAPPAPAALHPAPKAPEMLVICHETSSITGSHRPICAYVDEMRKRGAPVQLLDLQRYDKTMRARKTLPDAPVIVINSIAPLMWRCVRDLLADRREGIYLYVHETDWVLRKFSETHPQEYALLKEIADQVPILAVSEAQKRLFEERFGAQRVTVVRNVTSNANLDLEQIRPDAAVDPTPTILMVGSIQARKGPELFSMVADIAKGKRRPWQFRWIGGGHQDDLYQSEHVDWAGPKQGQELTRAYQDASLFFLPSADDPFPLSSLEAMSFGLGVVCFKTAGTAEIMHGLKGYASFDHYTADHAFAAVDRAMCETPNRKANFERAKIYADSSYFADVLNKAIFKDQGAGAGVKAARMAR